MLKGKTKHRTEEHHPVIAAVGLHSQRQMIDTEIILAHRHAITQMKIALVDSLPGVDEIDKAAVGGADRRDRRFVRPGVALPGGIPQRAGAGDKRRAVLDPQRHRAERYPVALIKMVGPAVRLMVDDDPRPAVAPQRHLSGAVASLMLKTQRLQMLPRALRLGGAGGEFDKLQPVIDRQRRR